MSTQLGVLSAQFGTCGLSLAGTDSVFRPDEIDPQESLKYIAKEEEAVIRR